MDKLWVYDGVAYHSRDLAILHGADEWNKNKAMILMLWANEYCSIENKLGL